MEILYTKILYLKKFLYIFNVVNLIDFIFFSPGFVFNFCFFHVFAYDIGNRRLRFVFLGVVLCFTALIGDRIHNLKNKSSLDFLSSSNGDSTIKSR